MIFVIESIVEVMLIMVPIKQFCNVFYSIPKRYGYFKNVDHDRMRAVQGFRTSTKDEIVNVTEIEDTITNKSEENSKSKKSSLML